MSSPLRPFALLFGLAFACGPAPSASVASAPSAVASASASQEARGGRLPPEKVRKVIRDNFPRFRQCYERGLDRNINLEGIVGVKFIIAEDGHVEGALLDYGTLPDPQVIDCVVDVYKTLVFPAPDGGKIAVRFPIDFRNDGREWPKYPGLNGQSPPDCRNPEVIATATASRKLEFAHCAEAIFHRKGRGGGYVVAEMTIEPTGNVSKTTEIHSSIDDAEAIQCVLAGFGAIRFPACGQDPIVVQYILTVTPNDDCTRWNCVDIGK